ncbi:MAG: 4Fe-4S dicluster domain-containing protein [Planctomycetota bacterium]|jgi:NAD-dependent dihydropyrimidine dehydrogenase PreA subunit|nr:4Fe-4S dicluster domain-containing protein [Planctomycetota bacterium]
MSGAEKNGRPRVGIDGLECKGCGRCVLACPAKCLEIGKAANARGYQPAIYRGDGCVGCGNCYYVCPEPLAIEIEVV